MLSTSSPILLHIEAVGSDANGLYVDVSQLGGYHLLLCRWCGLVQLRNFPCRLS